MDSEAFVKSAAVNLGIQVSLSNDAFISFGFIPRNAIGGPHRSTFLMTLYTVPTTTAVLICIPINKVSLFPTSSVFDFFFAFLIIGVLTRVR